MSNAAAYVLQVDEMIAERADDVGVVVSEGSLDEIEANATSVDDDKMWC